MTPDPRDGHLFDGASTSELRPRQARRPSWSPAARRTPDGLGGRIRPHGHRGRSGRRAGRGCGGGVAQDADRGHGARERDRCVGHHHDAAHAVPRGGVGPYRAGQRRRRVPQGGARVRRCRGRAGAGGSRDPDHRRARVGVRRHPRSVRARAPRPPRPCADGCTGAVSRASAGTRCSRSVRPPRWQTSSAAPGRTAATAGRSRRPAPRPAPAASSACRWSVTSTPLPPRPGEGCTASCRSGQARAGRQPGCTNWLGTSRRSVPRWWSTPASWRSRAHGCGRRRSTGFRCFR